MDEHSAPPPSRGEQLTIADVLQDPDPMGDLSRFAIEDLTPEEEDEVFRILPRPDQAVVKEHTMKDQLRYGDLVAFQFGGGEVHGTSASSTGARKTDASCWT